MQKNSGADNTFWLQGENVFWLQGDAYVGQAAGNCRSRLPVTPANACCDAQGHAPSSQHPQRPDHTQPPYST